MLTETDVLARISGLSKKRLRVCVSRAWVTPASGKSGAMFDEIDLARLRLISELRDNLGVNDDAVPIILSLIDQLNDAHRRLRTIDRAVRRQGPDMSEKIVSWLRAELAQE